MAVAAKMRCKGDLEHALALTKICASLLKREKSAARKQLKLLCNVFTVFSIFFDTVESFFLPTSEFHHAH